MTEALIEAFLNGNDEIKYMFNQKTKEILISEESEIGRDDNDTGEFLVPIPQMTSSEAYDLMVDFAKKQEPEVTQRLIDALNGKKPFRSFKDQIRGQEIEQAWYDYENDYAKRKMSTWLEHSL